MPVFKKAMSYLGLGPDDPYDDYELDEPEQRPLRGRAAAYAPEPDPAPVRTNPRGAAVREPTAPPSFPRSAEFENPPPPVRVQRPAASSSTVRTVPSSSSSRPHTVRPRRFDQAQEVADRFKEGQPVIVNLQDVERDLERRLIDFCSGICYGLDGKMEKVANGVYLLTPANASVSAEDRRLIGEFDE
jgi:cell division inhibitor SepF